MAAPLSLQAQAVAEAPRLIPRLARLRELHTTGALSPPDLCVAYMVVTLALRYGGRAVAGRRKRPAEEAREEVPSRAPYDSAGLASQEVREILGEDLLSDQALRVCHHPGSRLEWEVPKDPTARAHVPGRVLFRPPASAAHVPDPRASGSAFHAGGGAALRKRADLPPAVVTDLRAPGLPGDGEVCGGRALLAAGGLLPVPAGHSQGAAFLPEPGQALGTVLELRVFGYERSGEPFADDPKVSAHGGHGAQDAGGCGPGPCRWGACDCQVRRVPARSMKDWTPALTEAGLMPKFEETFQQAWLQLILMHVEHVKEHFDVFSRSKVEVWSLQSPLQIGLDQVWMSSWKRQPVPGRLLCKRELLLSSFQTLACIVPSSVLDFSPGEQRCYHRSL
ncbi:unnamed protein product [Effrenium voratum]|nr:unnamed protein product [Effrenium voratum]